MDAKRRAGGSSDGCDPPAPRQRVLASATKRSLSRLPREGPGNLGISPDGYPGFTIQPTRLRVSARRGAEEPVRDAPAETNNARQRNDDFVCNGIRDCRLRKASGVRVGEYNDLEKASSAVRNIAEIKTAHHLEMLKAMKEMRTILTDEQFKKLKKMMSMKTGEKKPAKRMMKKQ